MCSRGGEGDDSLSGGIGSDVYHFARGDGRDTLADIGGNDTLQFATGISESDVTVVQDGRAIELRIAGDGGRIRINDALNGASAIETIAFASGANWTWNEVLAKSILSSGGDDVIAAPVTYQSDLIVNGDFSQYALADVDAYTGWGISLRAIPGWTEATGQNFEYLPDDVGNYRLDMVEFYAAMNIRQVFSGMDAGSQLAVQFDYTLSAGQSSRSMEVLWNGKAVTTLTVAQSGTYTETLFVESSRRR